MVNKYKLESLAASIATVFILGGGAYWVVSSRRQYLAEEAAAAAAAKAELDRRQEEEAAAALNRRVEAARAQVERDIASIRAKQQQQRQEEDEAVNTVKPGWNFSHRQQNVDAQHLEELRNSVTPIVDSDEDSDEDYQNPMIPIPAGYSEGYERSRQEERQRLHKEANQQRRRNAKHAETKRRIAEVKATQQRRQERAAEAVNTVKPDYTLMNKLHIKQTSTNIDFYFYSNDNAWKSKETNPRQYKLNFVDNDDKVILDDCQVLRKDGLKIKVLHRLEKTKRARLEFNQTTGFYNQPNNLMKLHIVMEPINIGGRNQRTRKQRKTLQIANSCFL